MKTSEAVERPSIFAKVDITHFVSGSRGDGDWRIFSNEVILTLDSQDPNNRLILKSTAKCISINLVRQSCRIWIMPFVTRRTVQSLQV